MVCLRFDLMPVTGEAARRTGTEPADAHFAPPQPADSPTQQTGTRNAPAACLSRTRSLGFEEPRPAMRRAYPIPPGCHPIRLNSTRRDVRGSAHKLRTTPR